MNLPENQPLPEKPETVTDWDRILAPLMFVLAFAYLGILGIMVHLLADDQGRHHAWATMCTNILWGLTPLFFLECGLQFWSGGRCRLQHLLACLFPPLRLGTRDHLNARQVWLPSFGWKTADQALASDVERRLGYPMIGVALLILPVLGIQHFYAEQIQQHQTFALIMELIGALIWTSFAAEFIVLFSLVSKRFLFVKQHWLDLAIICLPLIAFLRTLRIVRVARISRTARIFRLRGLTMRAWRAILLLEIVDRLRHRNPQKRLESLHRQLAEKKSEIETLQAEITQLEARLPVVSSEMTITEQRQTA